MVSRSLGLREMSIRTATRRRASARPRTPTWRRFRGHPIKRPLRARNSIGWKSQKLRAVTCREQRSLCIYCERRVAEDHPTPRIDHWYPLSRDPGLALHWKNLYLSCPKPETCDSAKADHPFRWDDTDSHIPWPVDLRYEDVVGFTTRGEIYVRSDVTLPDAIRQALELAIGSRTDGAQARHGIVNLNDPALVKARVAAGCTSDF